jgi:hypothetical protein
MKNLKIVLLLIATFVLCFSSCNDDLYPVPDDDVTQFSDGDELLKKGTLSRTVPFKGRYVTHPEVIGVEEGIQTIEITSVGKATHLGISSWYSLSEVHLYTPEPWKQTGTLIFEKKGTGDQLIGSFEGNAKTNLPDNPIVGSGEYVITGGTGKFDGVIGSGTYVLSINTEMTGDLIFTGTLTFPGKNKHRRFN